MTSWVPAPSIGKHGGSGLTREACTAASGQAGHRWHERRGGRAPLPYDKGFVPKPPRNFQTWQRWGTGAPPHKYAGYRDYDNGGSRHELTSGGNRPKAMSGLVTIYHARAPSAAIRSQPRPAKDERAPTMTPVNLVLWFGLPITLVRLACFAPLS
jgi:hypothetical protein